MLHYIAACPYCLLSVIAIDIERRQLVFNPGCADNEPCDHLACFQVWAEVCRHEGEKPITDFGASINWIWERGSGLRENFEDSGPNAAFHMYYWELFLGLNFRPASPHEYVFLTVLDRELAFPGSGEFDVQLPSPGEFGATMDSFAIFGPDPARILRDVRAGFQVNFGFRNS
jgi:hypothetical protein